MAGHYEALCENVTVTVQHKGLNFLNYKPGLKLVQP